MYYDFLFHMICHHLYSILFELLYMIAAVYCYLLLFSLFHSLLFFWLPAIALLCLQFDYNLAK